MNDDWVRNHIGDLEPRSKGTTPLDEIYEAAHDYRINFLNGRPSTNNLYRAYHVQNPDRPSLNTVLRVAPLDDLLQEVEQPGWEERVATMPDPREPTPEQLAQREQHRLKKRAAKPGPQGVLQVIESRTEATARQIADDLDKPLTTIRNYLSLLRDAGLIYATQPITSSHQSYISAGDTTRAAPLPQAERSPDPNVQSPKPPSPTEPAAPSLAARRHDDWIHHFLDENPELQPQLDQARQHADAIKQASERAVAEICALLIGTPTSSLPDSLHALLDLLDGKDEDRKSSPGGGRYDSFPTRDRQ